MLHSQVSQDGHRLGIVHILGSQIHLEVFNLLPSLHKAFNIERTIPKIERLNPLCLSSKLDLLVLGRFALTIDIKSNELSPPIEFDIDLVTSARDWSWACTISNSGEFVAFHKPAYKHHLDRHDRQPGRSVIYRISRTERTATRLTTPYQKDLLPALLDFHPLLPLATFSSSEDEGSDSNQSDRESCVSANEINLSVIDLNTHQAMPLNPLQITEHVYSKLYFADTGDFLLLEGQYQKSRIIVSDIPCPPQPPCVIADDLYIHPSKDRSYILKCMQNSIGITMYKFRNLAQEDSLPAHQALESTARVENLTVFPSTIGRPKIWLFLGEDYSKPLRMLLQPGNGEPLVMKTLMVSWDEVRERLETTLMPV